MKPAVLVFDLDDTLFAEREFVVSGFLAVDRWLQEQRSVTGFAAEALRQFEAGRRGRIFDEVLSTLGVPGGTELVSSMIAIYRGHQPRLTLFPDAQWAFKNFQGRLKLGLITDGYAQTQRNKVAALAIAGFFDHLVFTDDLGRENWKPSPLPFQRMMELMGCEGESCIYVGDNPAKDFVAPNGLGWLTVQLQREGGEYEQGAGDTPGHRAQLMIRSLRDLGKILG